MDTLASSTVRPGLQQRLCPKQWCESSALVEDAPRPTPRADLEDSDCPPSFPPSKIPPDSPAPLDQSSCFPSQSITFRLILIKHEYPMTRVTCLYFLMERGEDLGKELLPAPSLSFGPPADVSAGRDPKQLLPGKHAHTRNHLMSWCSKNRCTKCNCTMTFNKQMKCVQYRNVKYIVYSVHAVMVMN